MDSLNYLKTIEVNGKEQTGAQHSLPPIGDLEPPMEILKLLSSSDAIKEDLNMELDHDPITSLLNFDLAKVKPPPPYEPSPLPPPPKSRVRNPPQVSPSIRRNSKPDTTTHHEPENVVTPVAVAGDVSAQIPPGIPVEGSVVEEQYQEADVRQEALHESNEQEKVKLAKRRDRDLQAQLDFSAGFRARTTRGGRAAAAAFEAEANGPSSPPVAGPSEPRHESDSVSASSKKRPPVTPTMQTSVPRVVYDVDNRDSFNMFHAGWILPPDQKRHGRPSATERQAVPPPKKKQKTGKFYPMYHLALFDCTTQII